LIEKLHKERPNLPKVKIPVSPKECLKSNFGVIKVTQYLTLNDILAKIKPIASEEPKQMELIDIGVNYEQNFLYYNEKPERIKVFTKSIIRCYFVQ
jgi:hypothetical protein